MLNKGQSAHERGNDSLMEESKYLALVQYITNQTYLKWIKTKGEQSRWKTEAAKFVIEEGLLKHIEKKVNFTLVIQKHQVCETKPLVGLQICKSFRIPIS